MLTADAPELIRLVRPSMDVLGGNSVPVTK
jgi:hypothetical protein